MGDQIDITTTDFEQAADVISRIHSGATPIAEVLELIRCGQIKSTAVLSDYLWAAHQLAGSEDDPREKQWHALRKEVHMKQLGVDEQQVSGSTRQFGPRYNALTDKGYLVPGSFDRRSIPLGGEGDFKGLCARPSGDIDFFFERLPNKPPMLFSQDIDVALIIVFSAKQKLPWLSLEQLDESFPDRPRWSFVQKQWDPEWIGHTWIGHTLYAADYWIGQLAWNSKSFPVSEQDIPDPDKRAKIVALLKEFEFCGGHPDGHSSRVMLKPGDVYGSWNRAAGGEIVCDIHRIDMGVDGSNIAIEVDKETNKMKENRLLNLNDPRFAMGRVALLLTRRYNEIAEYFPVFERGRQLVGLLKTLVELRDRHGFKPGLALSGKIEKAYQYYSSQPGLTLQQRLCSQLRFGD